ncbi:MAG: superoxide dismutase family protein [Hyphomonadaceae bacterium]|nr:superoxide dismutase family protein [Hyphomonadaceae bacterium]MBC6411916.1 superoxide dismutase family protein [Hyphomonadaceae bacterium]
MKKVFPLTPGLVAVMLLAACNSGNQVKTTPSIDAAITQLKADYPDARTFDVKNRDNEVTGIIGIRPNPDGGVQLVGYVENIPTGLHGMHFHEKADCQAPDFTSSGGHINPEGRKHGLKHPEGPDSADMPNVLAGADNIARIDVTNDRISLNGENGLPTLLDADGSALVIHENEDDQITQPIGGAGARIACAEIR